LLSVDVLVLIIDPRDKFEVLAANLLGYEMELFLDKADDGSADDVVPFAELRGLSPPLFN
jgi:hypothetical protein